MAYMVDVYKEPVQFGSDREQGWKQLAKGTEGQDAASSA